MCDAVKAPGSSEELSVTREPVHQRVASVEACVNPLTSRSSIRRGPGMDSGQRSMLPTAED